jgi:hypothetical protein
MRRLRRLVEIARTVLKSCLPQAFAGPASGRNPAAAGRATDVDLESGLVLLTTKLAQGSGEWISATWPVCRVTDLMNPKLMGASSSIEGHAGEVLFPGRLRDEPGGDRV